MIHFPRTLLNQFMLLVALGLLQQVMPSSPFTAQDAIAQSSSSWTYCASEGGQCNFSGTKQIRYGLNGTYVYGTFTNTVSCHNGVFGDPLVGFGKQCSYSEVVSQPAATTLSTTSATTISSAWTDCAGENQQCSFMGTKQIRYGANGTYFYGTFTNTVSCSNSVFGDPLIGFGKRCSYSEIVDHTSSVTSPTTTSPTISSALMISSLWTDCAGENQQCRFTGTKQIRYGANGTYFYGTFTDAVACSNSVFGDPLIGFGKRCSYSEFVSQTSPVTPTATPITVSPSSGGGYAFYIATTGSDSYTCAQAQNQSTPRRTIQGGIDCLGGGDTLFIKQGTYSGPSTPPPSGSSWDRATKIAKFGNDVVTVMGWPAFFGPQFQYIIVDGLRIDAANLSEGVMVGDSAHHIRVVNSEIFNARHFGVFIDYTSSYNEFIANNIYANGTTTNYDHGIYIEGSNNLIDNCKIYNNASYGVHLYSGIGQTVNHNVVRNNSIFSNNTSGGWAFGVVVRSGSSNLIYNNIISNNPNGGIQIGNTSFNAKIYNNTIVNNLGAGVWVYVGSSGTEIRNNIIYQNGRDLVSELSIISSNNLTQNPLFQNLAGGDFSLQSNSPAINNGAYLNDVPFDFNYVPRPKGGAFDIGAIEY